MLKILGKVLVFNFCCVMCGCMFSNALTKLSAHCCQSCPFSTLQSIAMHYIYIASQTALKHSENTSPSSIFSCSRVIPRPNGTNFIASCKLWVDLQNSVDLQSFELLKRIFDIFYHSQFKNGIVILVLILYLEETESLLAQKKNILELVDP